MSLATPTVAIAFVVLVWAFPASAQEFSGSIADTSHVISDTSSGLPNPIGEPFQMGEDSSNTDGMKTVAKRSLKSPSFFESPTGTLLKSVAFPGWGQWSNGKKQKAAVYFGIESYWITKALIWRHRARTVDSFSEFAHARDRRNYFYWLTGITAFVSMFDAYADRYLLTLERTRDMPDDFWGVRTKELPNDAWRLSLAIKF